jgi:caspase domain-containing protein
MRTAILIVLTLLGSLLSVAASAQDKRVALVIGNGGYVNAAKLPNPANDALAVSALLESAGFAVEMHTDLGNSEMRRVIRNFSDQAKNAEMAVVYYAGHGLEVDGTNFLVPTDAKLQRDIDVEDEAVALDRVLKMIEPARRLRLVILDACRDNPFVRTMTRTMMTRSVGRGLARIDLVTSDTLVAYAARAGSTAADGQGANSPFTGALLRHVAVPGLDLRIAFGNVRDEVLRATNNQQEPFVYGSLGGGIIALVPGASVANDQLAAPMPAPAPARSPTGSEPWRDYELAAQVGTVEGWDEFLRVYKTGFYANLARAQRSKLMAAPAAPAASLAPAPASPPAPAPSAAEPATPPAALASLPPQTTAPPPRTRTLAQPEPVKPHKREVERKRGQATNHAAAGAEGGGAKNNSVFCGYVRQHLGTAIAWGLDNRDGAITAAKKACR